MNDAAPHDDLHGLLDVAVEAVAERFGVTADRRPRLGAWARRPAASFVTLERDGRLLGCIGSLTPRRPLADDVAANALAAAFADPRMPPIGVDDLAVMDVKVSVLSALEPLAVSCHSELRAVVRPGIDGLLIEAGAHRATFLPAVWEKLGHPDDFLDQLWRKAGLAPRTSPGGMLVHRYTSTEVAEAGPRLVQPIGATRA